MDDLLVMLFVLAVFGAWVWVSGKNHRSRREHIDAIREHQDSLRDHWTRVEVWRAEAQEHARRGQELQQQLRDAIESSQHVHGENLH